MKKPLTIFLAALFLALVGGVAALMIYLNNSILDDPVEIRALADEIIPMEIPEGLTPSQGVQFFGGKLAIFEGTDVRNSLVLATFPKKAIEKSEANWEVQTQINWQQFDPEPKIEQSEETMSFAGREIAIAVSVVTLANSSYRAFLLQTEYGVDSMLKVYRVGPVDQVNAEHFQSLLDQAGQP